MSQQQRPIWNSQYNEQGTPLNNPSYYSVSANAPINVVGQMSQRGYVAPGRQMDDLSTTFGNMNLNSRRGGKKRRTKGKQSRKNKSRKNRKLK
jgi:hypothetical protein